MCSHCHKFEWKFIATATPCTGVLALVAFACFFWMKCDNAKIIVLGGVNVLKSRVILASAAVMHSDVNSNTVERTLSNYLSIYF